MSDDQRRHFSVDLDLPEALGQFESQLAAMPLPASRVARDELMYRAGWAAAEARAAAALPAASRASGGQTPPLWSTVAYCLASASLAAVLAVAVTLELAVPADRLATTGGGSPPGVADNLPAGPDEESSADKLPGELLEPPTANRRAPLAGSPPSDRPSPVVGGRAAWLVMALGPSPLTMPPDTLPPTSFLALRQRALSGLGGQADRIVPKGTAGGATDLPDPRPKNARELLREYLPQPSPHDTGRRQAAEAGLLWSWDISRFGETT